jgi:serine/threonine protein kinase
MDGCPSLKVVDDFVAGRLSVADGMAVHRHILACSICRARVDGLSASLNRSTIDTSLEVDRASAEAGRFIARRPRAQAATLSSSEQANERTSGITHDLVPVWGDQRYERSEELARGGIGRILRAHDKQLHRTVAVKELLNTSSPEAARRFVREALITARLQHPAIVPVYEAGRWPSGEPFYAMKLVWGRTLDKVIAEARTLEDRLALLPNVIAVAEAVAYAHSHRIIHRDLKPSNVLVGSFGETVVIDWGLAKELGAGETGAYSLKDTEAGTVLGTPAYMPPEQAEGSAVDERADVYALGALVYHVLAGQPPYADKNAAQTLSRVLAGPPPPLATREPGAPLELCAVVDKAMERQPKDRYPTAGGLVADLVRVQARRMANPPTEPAPPRRPLRRTVLALAILLAATVAGAGGTVLYLVHQLHVARATARATSR